MTEEERIFSGRLFASKAPELVAKKNKAHRLSQRFSALQLFGYRGENNRILSQGAGFAGGSRLHSTGNSGDSWNYAAAVFSI